MKKPTLKRVVLGLIQHFAAFGIAIIIAEIILNSYMTVEQSDGKTTYYLNPMNADMEFEETEAFADIFSKAVTDIIHYVVLKDQMEVDGTFKNNKWIDITHFGKRDTDLSTDASIYYELDDLIKWGLYGIEYTERAMSVHDFVNYFGQVILPENFALNEKGSLYFKGFTSVLQKATEEDNAYALQEIGDMISNPLMDRNALEDMVLNYILANCGDGVHISKEEDGSYTVLVKMISNRYMNAYDKKMLHEKTNNWISYIRLQNDLDNTIQTLSANYELYQNYNKLYEGNSNLKYTIRMFTESGPITYSNEVGMASLEESDITDYFSEFHCYMIYYPENLSYMGINPMSENEIYSLIREYDYIYPESTHIWISVDTNYTTQGDVFYHANSIYHKIAPYINLFIFGIVFLGSIWCFITLYLTVTAGTIMEKEEKHYYLNAFDHIWTEMYLSFVALFVFATMHAYAYLQGLADTVFENHLLYTEDNMVRLNSLLTFGLFGFMVSLVGSLLWYSMVRRSKCASIWRDSVLCKLLAQLRKTFYFVMDHKNSVISSLLPYSIFLLFNIISMLGLIVLSDMRIMLGLLLLVVDIFVGFYLYKDHAEKMDIWKGITNIREGNVDYKIAVESMHGDNQDLAMAVNTIGQGIQTAVRTSVKDEQMKTDLITNVSHDLKTPLTSIVNYIDLLKRLKLEDDKAKEYIAVLDTKAQRLKHLTDDLVEVSKISSGNIVLNMEILDLGELVKQALGEFSDILEQYELEPVMELAEGNALIYADSRRMWRIIENLFNNVCKYAMRGTRVFITITKDSGKIVFSMKNVSNHKLDVKADDLTERFFRGDVSRTTEGSGLGLSIAKSLTQVQGGAFHLEFDGDIFKAILSFHEYVEEKEEG